MYVKDFITKNVITIRPDESLTDAIALIKEHRIRRLPVVDENGDLIGIVAESDLLKASPSTATSLNIWELNYLLSKMKIKDIMKTQVITIEADEPLEKAARLMREKAIGAIPVTEKGKLCGIITESDIFEAFIEVMGFGEKGTRLTLKVEDKPGQLYRITEIIKNFGLNIQSIATFRGRYDAASEVVIRVKTENPEDLVNALKAGGFEIVHYDVF